MPHCLWASDEHPASSIVPRVARLHHLVPTPAYCGRPLTLWPRGRRGRSYTKSRPDVAERDASVARHKCVLEAASLCSAAGTAQTCRADGHARACSDNGRTISKKSFRRPGVAMTRCTPRRMSFNCASRPAMVITHMEAAAAATAILEQGSEASATAGRAHFPACPGRLHPVGL